MKKTSLLCYIIFLSGILGLFLLSDNYLKVESLSNVRIKTCIKVFNINGNAQLQAAASSGNGTYDDPYIIEDLVINEGGSSNFCIYIENTNAYFILRNCTATNGEEGITLDNVTNALIMNNTVYSCNYGISVRTSSYNCTLLNNTIYGISQIGIYLYFVDKFDVINNRVYSCGWSGIKAYSGQLHNISYNYLHDNHDGVSLDTPN